MGTRNLIADKQRQQQPPKNHHQLRNGGLVFGGGDDGGFIEQARSVGVGGGGRGSHPYGSNKDETTSYLNHHQRRGNSNRQHHESHQIQYVNPDGSIVTLSADSLHQQQQQQQKLPNNQTQTIYLHQSDDALKSGRNIIPPNSSISAGNSEQRPAYYDQHDQHHYHRGHNQGEPQAALLASSHHEQQHHHRLLQHQVHQQLQQIYENAEQKPAPAINPTRHSKHDHCQADNRQQLILKRQKQQVNHQDRHHHHHHHRNMQVFGQNVQPTEFLEREHQFRSAMIKSQQNLMMALNGQTNGLGNQQPHSLQQFSQHHEQQYDSLGPPGILKHQQLNEQQDFYVVGTETHGVAGQQRQHQHLEHQAPICSIPEECSSSSGNSNEDELLIPEASLTQSSNRAIIDRRSQLEDLHYATVTAAALLSATANAAAAFAATEKQYKQSTKEGRVADGGSGSETHSHLNQLNSISSDTYHEARKQTRSQQVVESQLQHRKQQQQHHQAIPANRLLKQRLPTMQQQHHSGHAPVYAITTDPLINFVNFAEQRAQPASPIATASAIYGPIMGPNQTQPQIYHIHQAAAAAAANYQQQQFQRNINITHQLQPPQPPIRRLHLPALAAPLLSGDPMHHRRVIHAIHHQRPPSTHKQQLHQQQQVPLTQPQAQALAMLNHRGGKGCVALRADMISRLLVKNLLASQRPLTSDNHYHQGGQPSSRALANKLLDGHGLLGRELIYGVAGREKLFGLSRANFHVQTAAAVAPSDSSGHSQVPLVLDRKLKPRGFIERICRIDLAVFWWSLLIISFLFVGALYTLSRYIL